MKSLLAICALICVAVVSGQNTCSRTSISWYSQNVNLPSQSVNGVQTYYANCRVWKYRGGMCSGQCPRSTSWYSGTRYNERCTCCKPKSVRTITPWAYCQYVVTFCPFVVQQWRVVRHPALNAHRYNYIQECDCLSCGRTQLFPSSFRARRAAPEQVEVSAVDLSALPEFNRAPETQADRVLRPSVVTSAVEKNRAVAQLSRSDQARRPSFCRAEPAPLDFDIRSLESAPRRAESEPL